MQQHLGQRAQRLDGRGHGAIVSASRRCSASRSASHGSRRAIPWPAAGYAAPRRPLPGHAVKLRNVLSLSSSPAAGIERTGRARRHLRHGRQVRQVVQRGRLQRRRALEEGNRQAATSTSRSPTRRSASRRMRRMAERGADPIIGVGFAQGSSAGEGGQGVSRSATSRSSTRWSSCRTSQSIVFKEHEGSFLVGMMAALASKTGKVGFVGGMDIPLIRTLPVRLRAGREVREPEGRGQRQHDRHHARGVERSGQAAASSRRRSSRKGVDVVFAAAGGTGVGVYQAAKDAGKLAIGVDSNQNHLQPGTMLTSMVKRVDVAVYNALQEAPSRGNVNVARAEGRRRRLRDRPAQREARRRRDEEEGRRGQGRHHRRQDQGRRLHGRQRLQALSCQSAAARPRATALRRRRRDARHRQALRRRARQPRRRPDGARAARVHGIVGENGAGKSTLMSILYGFYQRRRRHASRSTAAPARIGSSRDAIALGIGMVHQHFMLVDTLHGARQRRARRRAGRGAARARARRCARELERADARHRPRGRSRRARAPTCRSASASGSRS